MPQREPRLDPEAYDHITLRLLREWLFASYSTAQQTEILAGVAENVRRYPQSYLARMWRKIYRADP